MNIYIISLLFAIPIFIILIGLEAFIAFRRGIQVNRAADMISSLSSGLTNTTRDGIQFGFILISYTWLVDHITIIKLEPLWLAVIIAFISEDFAGYWFHRMNHRVNFFGIVMLFTIAVKNLIFPVHCVNLFRIIFNFLPSY